MGQKNILIVDDEEAILSVLKSSLKKLGPDYEVKAVVDGPAALALLQRSPFNLVITDYKMAGMNGLELLEAIRKLRPETRVIMMTAYSSPVIENEAQRLKVYRYLTKPLEISAFRQLVREALAEGGPEPSGLLILSDDSYRRINQLLQQLQNDVGGRCVFLTDAEGRFIARVGNVEHLPLEQIATLIGGSMATLLEAGRLIDGDADTTNLSYREGQKENLYVVNIGHDLLLIIICEHGPYAAKLGSVWYYAQQAAAGLRKELAQKDYARLGQVLGGSAETAIEDELDKLLGDIFVEE